MEGPCSKSTGAKCYVVASKSTDRPHIIQSNKSGQFSCESTCPMWQSSKICAHRITAAEFAHCLGEFVLWYNKTKSKPNLNKLSKVDIPKGTGRKGEKPPRKKKQGGTMCFTLVDQRANSTEQETSIVPVSSIQSTACTVSKSSNWNATSPYDGTSRSPFPPFNPWTCMPVYQNQCSHQQYCASPQMSNNFSFSPVSLYSPMGYQTWNTPFGTSSVPPPLSGIQQQAHSPVQHLEKNSNPFFVRFIAGNIRVCQDCRGSLRLSDGSVPSTPNNIVITHLERRQYFDKASGMWRYPQKETLNHYHL